MGKRKKSEIVVIGWTSYDDNLYPKCEEVDSEVFDAIVAEIREHRYCFGGDAHQNMSGCCPVLNNGTRVMMSTRRWGGVMAEAWNGISDYKYDYMDFYMDEYIGKEVHCYPKEYVDESKLVNPRIEHDFDMLPICAKDVLMADARPLTEETEKVKEGDVINFYSKYEGLEGVDDDAKYIFCMCCVKHIIRGKNFEEVLAEYMTYRLACPQDFDIPNVDTTEGVVKALYEVYGKDSVKDRGAVCYILTYTR